jgi:hypothetical protein
MSFTSVDIGFTDRRYSFDGPDFGSQELAVVDSDAFSRIAPCATCGLRNDEVPCVACADLEFIETVGDADELLDSVDRVEDEPELEEDEEDEEEDDDMESEKAWVSSPGIRF